jgi:hypothetical protein
VTRSSYQELKEISRDPVSPPGLLLERGDAQQAGGARLRNASRATGVSHPVTNYQAAFEEGRENLELAETMDNLATAILDNLDALVESLTRSD